MRIIKCKKEELIVDKTIPQLGRKLNTHILKNKKLWQEVINETILNKWADVKECAEWIYFVSSINKSMTAQEILIDNGEMAKSNFVW